MTEIHRFLIIRDDDGEIVNFTDGKAEAIDKMWEYETDTGESYSVKPDFNPERPRLDLE